MLRDLEEKYLDDVASVIKMYVDEHCQEQIARSIEDVITDGFEHEFRWGIIIAGDIRVLPNGTPAKSSDGKFIFDDFSADGDALFFLAFCFQEGELRCMSRRQSILENERYAHNTSCIRIGYQGVGGRSIADGDISIAEWREYIKNKYQIMPPALGREFVDFLWTCDIRASCGIKLPAHNRVRAS